MWRNRSRTQPKVLTIFWKSFQTKTKGSLKKEKKVWNGIGGSFEKKELDDSSSN
jgi:hypothetical protein